MNYSLTSVGYTIPRVRRASRKNDSAITDAFVAGEPDVDVHSHTEWEISQSRSPDFFVRMRSTLSRHLNNLTGSIISHGALIGQATFETPNQSVSDHRPGQAQVCQGQDREQRVHRTVHPESPGRMAV